MFYRHSDFSVVWPRATFFPSPFWGICISAQSWPICCLVLNITTHHGRLQLGHGPAPGRSWVSFIFVFKLQQIIKATVMPEIKLESNVCYLSYSLQNIKSAECY